MKIHELLKYSSLAFGASVVVSTASASGDYGPAIWRPACSGHWYTSGYGKRFFVIHDMEGYYLSTISYFQACSTSASVHYCVNGVTDYSGDAAPGEISQMVADDNYAWHVGCWNRYCMGTEHEGFASSPAWYTGNMYRASAALTAAKASKYGFAKDRNHLVGHGEWQNASWRAYASGNFGIDVNCNTHTDPGPYWDWNRFMSLVKNHMNVDYDGNGSTDYAVYRPSNSTFYKWNLFADPTVVGFGNPGDIPVPGDYNGDGITDYAVWRPSTATWYVFNLFAPPTVLQWGLPGDIPVPGDYDGDGITDFAVWRPSNGTWYVWRLFAPPIELQWGVNGDIPVPGDYDNNGTTDFVVFRPSNSTWYKWNLFADPTVLQFGATGDIPVPGDYDGNGSTDFAVWRPSNGTWYKWNLFAPPTTLQWGLPGDIPCPGDRNLDGATDFCVWRPSTGTFYSWYLFAPSVTLQWGVNGDQPLGLPWAIKHFFFP